MAYTAKDFENQFRDFYKIRQHELLVATESNAPFPSLAENEQDAKIAIETAIANHAWEKLATPQTPTPNFKEVLPPLAAEAKISTVGWLANSLFKPQTESKKPAPAAEQTADSKKRFDRR